MPPLGIIGLSWKTRQRTAGLRSGRSARALSRRRLPIRHQGQTVSEKMSIWTMTPGAPGASGGAPGLDLPGLRLPPYRRPAVKPKRAAESLNLGWDMDGAGAGIHEAGPDETGPDETGMERTAATNGSAPVRTQVTHAHTEFL